MIGEIEKIETWTEGDDIFQRLSMDRYTTVIKTQEAQVRAALVRLGWTPPDGESESIQVLRQIIRDLPMNKDWLDPTLERRARDATGLA